MKPPRGCYARLVAGSQNISTRRLLIFLSGIFLLSVSALLFIPATMFSTMDSGTSVIKFELPESISESLTDLNPFKPTSHKPPVPLANSTASSSSWYSSWEWLNPFSSNIAADEERSVLPPLQKRCPVYTFYDPSAKGEDAEVEDKLLLAWRRAFWAQGFKPIILGMGDAKEHGLFRVVNGKFNQDFERELMRWLAWSKMGTGVLVDYRVIPMAPWNDNTLTALRRCDFTYVIRYEDWGHRVFAGDKSSVDAVLKHITSNKMENNTVTIEAATKGAGDKLPFHIEPIPKSFADYTSEAVKMLYPKLKFGDLPGLINSHLHENFLSTYPGGISLLSPLPVNLGALHHPAEVLANRIASCPFNKPEPLSCPSNKKGCNPCKARLIIKPSVTLTNKTGIFSVGTIPHPYTFIALRNPEINLSTDAEDKSIRFVRRRVERDEWVRIVTTTVKPIGSAPRVLTLKQAIVDPTTAALLSTSDAGFQELDWTLGFTLPTEEQLKLDIPKPNEHQKALLDTTHKDAFSSRDGGKKRKLRKVTEAWNLGNTEVWKFATAFTERSRMERMKWSEGEAMFRRGLSAEEKKL